MICKRQRSTVLFVLCDVLQILDKMIENQYIQNMKIVYMLLLVLLGSCKAGELMLAEQMGEANIFEFAYKDAHFNGDGGSGVDSLNTIDGFGEYFHLENNTVIRNDTSAPFTGKIILYNYFSEYQKYDGMLTEIDSVRELYFTNGYLFQLEYTSYSLDGDISLQEKYNVLSFFDNQKRMKYNFENWERYVYFGGNLIYSGVTEEGAPYGLVKITRYKTTGKIEEEGYGQIGVIVPRYYNTEEHYGRKEEISWDWQISRVGIWKHYWDDENYYERMWGLRNIYIDDIKTYEFSMH